MKYFDDDMDELFNKAGRDYPLKTDPTNWDAVRGVLYPGEVTAPPVAKNGWRRYLPLLLLLLIPLGVYLFVERDGTSLSSAEKDRLENTTKNEEVSSVQPKNDKTVSDLPVAKNASPGQAASKKTSSGQPENNQTVSDLPVTKNALPQQAANKKTLSVQPKNDETVSGLPVTTNALPGQAANKKTLSVQPKNDKTVSNLPVTKNASSRQAASKETSSDQPQENGTVPRRRQSAAGTPPDLSINKNSVSKKTEVKKSKNENLLSNNVNNKKSISEPFLKNDLSDEDLMQWSKFPPYGSFQKPEINIPVTQQTEKAQSVPNTKKNKPSNKKGFYYGIAAGPDISRIKAQKVKGTGYSAGIVAGYQLTGHWSVEAGLLWSRKKYFTAGKYFSKEGAQIPSTVDITWLNGGCDMFEFPLLARYDFSVDKNTFFATAGLISYMMRKEDYKYGAWAGPGPWYYEGEREYKRSGDHLFSNLQFSAGYKFSLSPKMNLRIEPYLKAPLKKIGIGKMPITSAGLLFGITRDFR